jgi:RNA recognition motif-containing protein
LYPSVQARHHPRPPHFLPTLSSSSHPPPSRCHHAFHSGDAKDTKGSAFVIFEDIYDAKNAQEHLSGFNVENRYINVIYHNPQRVLKAKNLKEEEEELRALQAKYKVDGKQHSDKKKG